MDWNDIRLLVEVHRHGSLRLAAERLGTSVATVSRRLVALEADSGVRLFERHSHGSTITAKGEVLLQRALKVEGEVAEFRVVLAALAKESAAVRVRASEGVASYLLTPLLEGQDLGPLGLAGRRLGIVLPEVKLLTPASVERSQVDILWTAPEQAAPGRPTDMVRKVASIRFAPFVGAAYAAKAGAAPQRIADLVKHRLITLDAYQLFGSEDALGPWNRLVAEARQPVMTTGWTHLMGHMTAQGSGISLLPTYSPMYSDLLKPVTLQAAPMVCDLWLRTDPGELKDQRVRRCWDGLARAFKGADW